MITSWFLSIYMVVAITTVDAYEGSNNCTTEFNGKQIIVPIGTIWNSTDPCKKFTCKTDENLKPRITQIINTCPQDCKPGFKRKSTSAICCGECIRSTCPDNTGRNKQYNPGDSWNSLDNCSIYQCIESITGPPQISSFRKICPEVPANCPHDKILIKDCCPTCNIITTKDANSNQLNKPLMDTYVIHPCKRECTLGSPPMICKYKFVAEWYETLSKACFDCPFNQTDCNRPHCIVGDGSRRSVMVINRMMPGPSIEVCENDTIVVDVTNMLLGETTSIHWHGQHHKETPYMDGVPDLTQCPISPHTTFRYTFRAEIPGTHFWHSHTGIQRIDGIFGALIIRSPRATDPHSKLYDFDLSEHVLTLQDWVHTTAISMFTHHHHSIGDNKALNILINGRGKYFAGIQSESTTTTSTTLEPETEATTQIPDIIVKNEHKRSVENAEVFDHMHLNVDYGYSYRFRIINSGFLNCPIQVSVDNHTILIISSDGFPLEPVEAASFLIYAGERFDFVLNANQEISNYYMRFKGLIDCDERFNRVHQAIHIHYNGAINENEPSPPLDYNFTTDGLQINSLNKGPGQVDSLVMSELSAMIDGKDWLHKNVDHKFYMYFDFYAKDNPLIHAPNLYGFHEVLNPKQNSIYTPQMNLITLKMPDEPLLPARHHFNESKFCNETSLAAEGRNCRKEFCSCIHVVQVQLGDIVEIILIDEGVPYEANHPLHLHGYAFRVLGMDRIGESVSVDQIKRMDENGLLKRNLNSPPIKDTITVPDGGYTIIRFQANNPGYWLLHCHVEFHISIGMGVILKVGENSEMKPVPENFPQCSSYMPELQTTPPKDDNTDGCDIKTSLTVSTTIILSIIVIYLF